MLRHGVIDEGDLRLFSFADDPETAFHLLQSRAADAAGTDHPRLREVAHGPGRSAPMIELDVHRRRADRHRVQAPTPHVPRRPSCSTAASFKAAPRVVRKNRKLAHRRRRPRRRRAVARPHRSLGRAALAVPERLRGARSTPPRPRAISARPDADRCRDDPGRPTPATSPAWSSAACRASSRSSPSTERRRRAGAGADGRPPYHRAQPDRARHRGDVPRRRPRPRQRHRRPRHRGRGPHAAAGVHRRSRAPAPARSFATPRCPTASTAPDGEHLRRPPP